MDADEQFLFGCSPREGRARFEEEMGGEGEGETCMWLLENK